jgi:hypothetical protein
MSEGMRSYRPRKITNSPKFIINNLGDVHTVMNAKMAGELATLILNTELHDNEGHLFAFAKQLEKAKMSIESQLSRIQQEIDTNESEGDDFEDSNDDDQYGGR